MPGKIVEHLPRLEREQLERFLSRALAQEQLQLQVLNALPDAVIAVAADGAVCSVNAAARDILGVTPTELIGRPLANSIKDANLRAALAHVDRGAYVTLDVQVSYPRRLALIARGIPCPASGETASDERVVWLLVLHDVSDEHARRVSRERASRLEALRLLTAGVAHEIGNPLSAIIMHTQLMGRELKKMRATARTRELTRINTVIQDESVRLKRIVGSFLDAVRPLPLALQLGSITEVLEESLALLAPELAARNINVRTHLKTVPATALDPVQLRSAILNIIRNAMDAMPGGGRLDVDLHSRGDWIELAFKDTGCGIPHEVQARLFTAFFTTKPSGAGLGMFIVQRIMHALGGGVRVQSEEGRGTEVILDLPVRGHVQPRSLPSPFELDEHEENHSHH